MHSLAPNPGPRATLGVPYKLVSSGGSLLGVLTVPDGLADILKERGGVQFELYQPVMVFEMPDRARALRLNIATLGRHYGWQTDDAVQLSGVTLEEIELQPGFAFSPGAGYLRSLWIGTDPLPSLI